MMLAMRDEEIFVLMIVFGAGITIVWMALRYHQRRDQLKTIQQAIAAGNLDEATRNRLIDALAQDTRQSHQLWDWLRANSPRIVRTIVVVAGWLTFVISGALLIGFVLADAYKYDIIGAAVGVGVGFALLTLPLALREVESRRAMARD